MISPRNTTWKLYSTIMVNRYTSSPPLVTNNVLTCASQPQSESSSLPGSLYSQSLTQTRASRVSGVIELRLSLRIRPLKLNADSEDTVLNGIARKSRAMVVLSVETHRRAATGNTKSREVAGTLAGTAPSSTARNSSTRHGLWSRRACHLTYTRSGRCECACNDLPAYTNTWKRKSEPWSAPRDNSCIGFKESIESWCQIGSAYPDGNR